MRYCNYIAALAILLMAFMVVSCTPKDTGETDTPAPPQNEIVDEPDTPEPDPVEPDNGNNDVDIPLENQDRVPYDYSDWPDGWPEIRILDGFQLIVSMLESDGSGMAGFYGNVPYEEALEFYGDLEGFEVSDAARDWDFVEGSMRYHYERGPERISIELWAESGVTNMSIWYTIE